jgi:hypothetical protein
MVIVTTHVTIYNLPAVLLPFLVVLFVSDAVLPVRFAEGQSETFDPWVDGGQGTGPKYSKCY